MAKKNKTVSNDAASQIQKIAEDMRQGAITTYATRGYIFGMLLWRYMSERCEDYVYELTGQQYQDIDDDVAENAREQMVNEIGFFISPSELFCNVKKSAASNDNLNITIANTIKNIENCDSDTEHAGKFSGIFSAMDIESTGIGKSVQARITKLAKLMSDIASIEIKENEYSELCRKMTLFYSDHSDNKSDYISSDSLINVMSEIIKRYDIDGKKIYDPACGSGSLLAGVKSAFGNESSQCSFYGQDIDTVSYNLARMRMIFDNIPYEKWNISNGDTLISPDFQYRAPFDVIACNVDSTAKWLGEDSPVLKDDPRFSPVGKLAPKKNADLAFVQHAVHNLDNDGIALIALFPGALYRDGAEHAIRKWLVENNLVEAVIQMPGKLTAKSKIGQSMLVIRKNRNKDDQIEFVDATELCDKVGKINVISNKQASNIADMVAGKSNADGLCVSKSVKDIADSKYCLSVSIEKTEKHDEINIVELNKQVINLTMREAQLRSEIDSFIMSNFPESLPETIMEDEVITGYSFDCNGNNNQMEMELW